MTIFDKWISFNTNIYIFGIREDPNFPACVELLDRIGELQVYIPRQINRELQNNLRLMKYLSFLDCSINISTASKLTGN